MASDGETTCTNDPNFAVIYSFLKVFGKLYGLEIPSIAKLQESVENTEDVPELLKDIHVRLLRRALKSVQPNRWERCLIKFCHHQGYHQEAWEVERFSYKKASTLIKLKVLKILLEYQFTCHGKFKSAVNALSCKDLRLDPVGTDKNGCVFWLQVDDDANLRLYKEDQDEETWQLVARNREEFVSVIEKLKKGEEVGVSAEPNITNEDSNSAEVPPELLLEDSSQVKTDDENEEFLSPESESEPETYDTNDTKDTKDTNELNGPDSKPCDIKVEEIEKEKPIESNVEDKIEAPTPEEQSVLEEKLADENPKVTSETDNLESVPPVDSESNQNVNHSSKPDKEHTAQKDEKLPTNIEIEEPDESGPRDESSNECIPAKEPEADTIEKEPESSKVEGAMSKDQDESRTPSPNDTNRDIANESDINPNATPCKDKISVSETVEEPVMHITGEGNGADCDSSYYIGEEIEEPVIYFWGDGSGYENATGNPDVIEQNSVEDDTNKSKTSDSYNGECLSDHSNPAKIGSSIKLRSSQISVAKRSFKNPPNDSIGPLKSDPKKHCVRDIEKSDSSSSISNDKSNGESLKSSKQNKRKTKSKVKKTNAPPRKIKLKEGKDVANEPSATDHCNDSKATIIEKRKSSISSTDHEEEDHTDNDKDISQSPEKEVKIEECLPPKKLKLEKTLNSNNEEETDPLENNVGTQGSPKNCVSQRKTIKASRGKFKRKKRSQESDDKKPVKQEESDSKQDSESPKKRNAKSLKRSLIDACQSDKNKSDSQSETEEEEQATLGKRLKIKPKKIITASRKKVEAKIKDKNTSDESEEETLYSLAGKKSVKKTLKKRIKGGKSERSRSEKPDKTECPDDEPPVRQSRRIAQLKIREEAQRRHQEEVALRELKIIHKKKSTGEDDEEEEWRLSGCSSASEKPKPKRGRDWRASESTPPPSDTDSEPIYEPEREEPDLDFSKSDHEFSPESDLEGSEPVEPTKLARTMREEKDDGYCRRCGSGEQPEWILLCDTCDDGYHAACLKPVLFLVPAGDWHCPRCLHTKLIASLEEELTKYDELVKVVEKERARRKLEEPPPKPETLAKQEKNKRSDEGKTDSSSGSGSGSSSWSSSEEEGAVYRLRERRQLPVSYRDKEYDRLISSAIKEEYVEASSSAGNQGRGKDISTIIEAAEEEKLKAEQEAIDQGKPVEKKSKRKQRRKPRKLNSLEVPSEDDDTDEDFKDTGMESTSEDISSEAERDSPGSRSSDSLPISRACAKKDRSLDESSSDVKKKKKAAFKDSSSDSCDAKRPERKSKSRRSRRSKKKRSRSRSKKGKRRRGLTQYDAQGNVIRARVTYGGLSGGSDANDWSPKHRTRQKKINYTETPNTESEEEMHKSSGKHMADSSDEFKLNDSELSSDSDRAPVAPPDAQKALCELVSKTAVVPLEKLSEEVTRAKTEELAAHLSAQSAAAAAAAAAAGGEGSTPRARPRSGRGRGGRGGRGSRGPRGSGGGGRARYGARPSAGGETDEALSKLVGIKIKDLGQSADATPTPSQLEKEKKRLEREAKLAEKEARKLERIQKKEEKDKLKEQKAKEREEKRIARLAVQESKRIKKERPEFVGPVQGMGFAPGGPRPVGAEVRMPMYHSGAMPARHPGEHYPPEQQRFGPRLQVRPELRAMQPDLANVRAPQPHPAMREGTLSVAGSPQPFKPVSEEPSIITRMPHMMNQYRGPMMFTGGNSPYGYRGQNMSMFHPAGGRGFPPGYYPPYGPRQHMPPPTHEGQTLPPGGSPLGHSPSASGAGPPPGRGQIHGHPGLNHPPGHGPPGPNHGPHGPSGPNHGPPGQSHGPPGLNHGPPGPNRGPPGSNHGPSGLHAPPPLSHRPPGPNHGPPRSSYGPPGSSHGPPGSSHGPPGSNHGPPGSHHGPAVPNHGPHGPIHGPPGSNHGPHGSIHGPPGSNHGPPGSNHGPPGSHHGPPGSNHGPPGSSHGPPGSNHGPPGSNHGPPGSNHGPPGSNHGPPGSSHGPPGSNHGPPGSNHGPPGSSHGPPGSSHGLPGSSHGPPGSNHGPPGSSHGPPGSNHGPPRPSHGPPGSSHGPPGLNHGPPGSNHGSPGSNHGPPGSNHGPPGSNHGPPGSNHGPPGSTHGPPGGHGPTVPNYGPHHLPPRPPHGSPVQTHGLPLHRPGSNQGLPHGQRLPLGSPLGPHGPPRHPLGPVGQTHRPPRPPAPATPPSPGLDTPVKVKAEVKAEPESSPPEYRAVSPRDDAPRLGPKIKHTEGKDRRPRHPLGPYAPQYGPYGPYAPPAPLHQFHHSIVGNLNPKPEQRTPPPGELHGGYPPHYLQLTRPPLRPHYPPPHYAPHPGLPPPPPRLDTHSLPRETVLPAPSQATKEASAERVSTPPVDLHKPAVVTEASESPPPPATQEQLEPLTEEGPEKEPEQKAEEPPNPPQEGVFGGLVSYFSSQREDDDIDA